MKSRNRNRTEEAFPEGPSTQHLRTLAPKAIGMAVGTRDLKYEVLGPSEFVLITPSHPEPKLYGPQALVSATLPRQGGV